MNIKHIRIRPFLALLTCLGLLAISSAGAATYTATNNAGWNTAATWDPNGIPGVADTAVIPVGKTVTYGGTPADGCAVFVRGNFSPSSDCTLEEGSVVHSRHLN